MATFTLPVRHTREVTDLGVECREENFRLGHRLWTLPLAQCALVMVDCWDQHVVVSHLERGGRIAQDHILPVVQAFRDAGMPVVHAPSPGVAEKFSQFMQYHDEMPSKPTAAWPPADFRARTGHYADFARSAEPALAEWSANSPERLIIPCLTPVEGDIVVANGEQLHKLCESRGILHLFFVGFATNICVEHRDYGTRAMADRGYNVILLRDGTTGIELTAGLDSPVRPEFSMTQAAILNIELKVGHSATCGALATAVRDATMTARL